MKNIVLIGFMGTGKTSTGKLLANRLSRPFLDMDKKIEIENNTTIAEMFQQYGEAYFRQKEQEMIVKAARYTNAVIATGGGAVLAEKNVAGLKSTGVIISLTASLEVILERTGRRNTRPLLNCPERAEKVAHLLSSRRGLYEAAADYVVDTSQRTPQQVVDLILSYLRQGGYLRGRS
ncbi:MAG: shikimate kinase [Pelosinus sp.]|nr:shikimate kinase [Pelosinus sp.]